MRLTRALHGSDLLELTDEDIALLRNGNSLQASGLVIKKLIPDVVMYYKHEKVNGTLQLTYYREQADLRVTYSGQTGEIINAEILK